MNNLVTSLQVQCNAVGAILLREMHSRFARSRFGFFTTFFEPVLIITTLYVMTSFLMGRGTRHGVPLAVYLTTGYLVHYAFRNMLIRSAVTTQQTSAVLAHPNITVVDNILGNAVSVWLTYTCVSILLSTAAIAVAHANLPYDLLYVIFGYYSAMWLGLTLGVIIGVGMRYAGGIVYLLGTIMRASLFISGAVYSADMMPKWLLPYLAWNPVFHAIEILREGWTFAYHSPIANPYYVMLCLGGTTTVAFQLERLTRYYKIT